LRLKHHMTRLAHDQLAKQYLQELLSEWGQLQTSYDIASEVRQIDVWFVPTGAASARDETLGLLGQMAATACVFEPFRNQPSPGEVRNCQLKLYVLHGDLVRSARRDNRTLAEADLPYLWILSPSCSARLIAGFGATEKLESWEPGVYLMPEFHKTALVAINQLPVNQNTLWLRVLGRGATQEQAIAELVALPEENVHRRQLLEILANWRINLEINQNVSDEDKELIMNLSPAYLRWREETLQEGLQTGLQTGRQEGLQEGLQEGQRLMVESMLAARFGAVDEELSQIITPLMQLDARERALLILQLSRSELVARFREPSN